VNLLKEAGHVLATVAPTIATAVGGPFAGMAVSALQKALGLTPSDTSDGNQAAIEQALSVATPEQILALKKAENDFTVQMEQLGITRDKLVFDDIASARAMQVAVRDPTVARLAWLVIGGFLLVSMVELAAMLIWPDRVKALPEAAWLLVGSVLGYLANESKQAGAFYFGSSAGSQAKDATISDLAKQP
jgi:curli biogenesis system outer membrane secretion channel CsgG